jgi:L-ribulose-5-phosphate 3-epimerase
MYRRHFLQFTATATLAAAFTPSAFAAPKRKLQKAIMYSTIGFKGTVLEKFKAMKEAGFEGVELMGGMDRAEVKAALQATGLQAASVCCHTHWAKPLTDANPEVRKVGIDGLKLSLEDAKAYGTDSVLLVPGVVSDKVSYDDAWKRSQEEIRKAVPLAEQLGVKIAIENVWNNFLLSPIEAARYVDDFKSPSVAWHLDLGNIGRYGWAEQWVRVLGKRISRLHIKEWNNKRMNDEGLWKGFGDKLLEGTNNWAAIMQALDEVGYTGWGITEQSGSQAATIEAARDLVQRIYAL